MMWFKYCAGVSRRMPRNTARDAPRQQGMTRRGQAAVEYMLLLSVVVLIFGVVFSQLRKSLYVLWVCEVAPRVQAPTGCGANTSNCWQQLSPESQVPDKCVNPGSG